MKKINTFVYRNTLGDCTANGLTGRMDMLDLYSDVTEQEVADLPNDALILIKRELFGKQAWYALPIDLYKSKRHSMAGGNFVYTSDSRFPAKLPISVHDRVEN